MFCVYWEVWLIEQDIIDMVAESEVIQSVRCRWNIDFSDRSECDADWWWDKDGMMDSGWDGIDRHVLPVAHKVYINPLNGPLYGYWLILLA